MRSKMDAAFDFIFGSDVLEELDNVERILRQPRTFKERPNYFEEYDDIDFCTRFRLTKKSVLHVLELIKHKLEFPSDRNEPVSPINQLLLTLRYYATGSHQISVGDYCGTSRSTSHRIIHRVTAAIASLGRKYIKFPDAQEELRSAKLSFYEIARFPRALGVLDCTHVRIRSPGGENAEYFRNQKGYMSINVQAIGSADLEILDLVARWPGSSQDQTIWNASHRKAIFDSGRYGDAVLLADSGYLNQSYVMMPLENPRTAEEVLYNESQIRTRNLINRLFGIWKRRFPVLALGLKMQLINCLPVIIATGVLHNIVIKAKEELPADDPELELPVPWEELLDQGKIREQRNYDKTAIDINPVQRLLVKKYFKSLHLNTNKK